GVCSPGTALVAAGWTAGLTALRQSRRHRASDQTAGTPGDTARYDRAPAARVGPARDPWTGVHCHQGLCLARSRTHVHSGVGDLPVAGGASPAFPGVVWPVCVVLGRR